MSLRSLLDTHVVSELARRKPPPGLVERVAAHEGELAIASLVWHELRYGPSLLPPSRRRDTLERFVTDVRRLDVRRPRRRPASSSSPATPRTSSTSPAWRSKTCWRPRPIDAVSERLPLGEDDLGALGITLSLDAIYRRAEEFPAD